MTSNILTKVHLDHNRTTWLSHSVRDSNKVLRLFLGMGGQLLHLLCGFKLWFGEMHHFESSGCFSNVLIKNSSCVPLSLLPPARFQG